MFSKSCYKVDFKQPFWVYHKYLYFCVDYKDYYVKLREKPSFLPMKMNNYMIATPIAEQDIP